MESKGVTRGGGNGALATGAKFILRGTILDSRGQKFSI